MLKRIFFTVLSITLLLSLGVRPTASQSSSPLADSPWPTYQHDTQHTGRSPFAGPVHQPVLLWTNAKPLDTSLGHIGPISIAPDGNLILYNENLIKYDPVARKIVWQTFENGTAETGPGPGLPLLGSDASIYWAYDAFIAQLNQDGQKQWVGEINNNRVQGSSPQFTPNGDIILVHDALLSINPHGSLNWTVPFSYFGGGIPAIDKNGKIYFSGQIENQYVFCASWSDGSIDWCKTLPRIGDVSPNIAIDSNGFIYTNGYSHVFKLSPNGELLWSFQGETGGSNFFSGMAIGPSDVVYAYFNRYPTGTLYAFSPAGQILWETTFQPNPKLVWGARLWHPPFTDRNGNVYLCLANAHCYGVSPQGKILWDFEFPLVESIETMSTIQPALIKDGVLWLVDNHGAYYVLADPEMHPVLAASESSIQFGVDLNASDITKTVKISSSIPGYPYRIEPLDVNWMTVDSLTGTTDSELTLQLHPTALPQGAYQTALKIHPDGWIGNDITIPINLSVGIHDTRGPNKSYLPLAMKGFGERILYNSIYFNDKQIVSISPSGSNRTPIITNISTQQFYDDFMYYSPDGRKVALYVYGQTAVGQPQIQQIAVYDTVTGKPTHWSPLKSFEPSWSGDSSRLAYIANRDGKWDIYNWELASGKETRVTNDSTDEANIIWSPDGNWLAYRTGGTAPVTRLVRPDGSENQTLPKPNGTFTNPAAWSPNGNFLLILGYQSSGGNTSLWKYDMQTKSYTMVTQQMINNPKSVSWSPDGSKIVFISHDDVYVVNSDGSGLINLTNTIVSESGPSWSPDSQSIVFARMTDTSTSATGDLYTIRADGTGLTKITNNILTDTHPFWAH